MMKTGASITAVFINVAAIVFSAAYWGGAEDAQAAPLPICGPPSAPLHWSVTPTDAITSYVITTGTGLTFAFPATSATPEATPGCYHRPPPAGLPYGTSMRLQACGDTGVPCSSVSNFQVWPVRTSTAPAQPTATVTRTVPPTPPAAPASTPKAPTFR